MILSFYLGIMLRRKIPKMLETHTHEKFTFQHHREIKMSQDIVFRSNCETKMLRNIVFGLSHGIKVPRNPKIVKKPREIKMPRKFQVAIIKVLKSTDDHNSEKMLQQKNMYILWGVWIIRTTKKFSFLKPSIIQPEVGHHRSKLMLYNKEKSLMIAFKNENIPTLPQAILSFTICNLVQ